MAEPGTPSRWSRVARRVVSITVTVLLLLTLGYLAVAGWSSTSTDLDRVRSEQRAVEYLRPAVELLAALGEARAAATGGAQADDQAVRVAVTALEAVDVRNGDALGVRQRWLELRRAIGDGRLDRTGPAAFTTGGDLSDQVVELLTAVDRAASVSSDQDPATRGLAGAMFSSLPVLVSESGRLAAAGELPRSAATQTDIRVTALDRVGRAAADLDVALRSALGVGTARGIDVGLFEEVRLAVGEFAPLPALPGAAPVRPVDPPAGSLERLDGAAVRLTVAVSAGVDRTLSARESDLVGDRWLRAAVSAAALLLALGVLWVRLPAAPRMEDRVENLDPVVRGPQEEEDSAARSARLVDARALLRDTEVVHVGRAVRTVPRREAEADDGPA